MGLRNSGIDTGFYQMKPPVTNRTDQRRWGIVALLAAGFTIAYVDRTNLSIALATPEFRDAFSLTDVQRGLLNSAFFWSYALLQIPAGYLTDRFGVRWPYAISFLIWSVVSAATALAGSFQQLFALRLLLGVGEAIVTPASMRWIALNVPEQRRGLAVAILFSGAKIGPALGADLSVRLIAGVGWQGMFLVLGLGSLVFLVPWLLFVKDGPAERPISQSGPHSQSQIAGLFRTPLIYGILIGTLAYNYFNYFNLTWLPAYFVERWRFPLKEMGAFTAMGYLGMAAVAILSGAVADFWVRRGGDPVRVRKFFTMAGLAIAATEIFGSLTASRDIAVFFALLSLAGLGMTTANYWALTQTLMPGAAIGRISGIQNCAANVAGAVAPAVTGWLVQSTGSYDAPMRAILVMLLMGLASYAMLVRRKYSPR
jgi:MFS family permease